jgi:uncharacterized protein with HEPN domain
MYDKTLALDILQRMEETLAILIEGTKDIKDLHQLSKSASGMIRLKGICMSLLVVGEEIKSLDKHTGQELLCHYPAIPWKDIMRMRDIIAHHYFEINEEIVFSALHNDVRPLMETVRKMMEDLEK